MDEREQRRVVYVAGFWRRALAALADAVILIPLSVLLVKLAGRVAGLEVPSPRRMGIDYWLDLALAGDPGLLGALGLTAAIVLVYLLLFQAMAGRTLGMRLLKIRIVDVYGENPTALRAAVRTLGYLASLATGSLGFLWIGFDREKRGLHDWLAGTYVVKPPPKAKAAKA
jgi:uncharacterized RDD family membrane protein YckC